MAFSSLRPRDAVYIARVLLDCQKGDYDTADKLVKLVCETALASDGFYRWVCVINHVNIPELRSKLESANETFLRDLTRIMDEVWSSRHALADNGLPSRAFLGRVGLLAPQYPVAQGICLACVKMKGWDEIVLRYPERIARHQGTTFTLEEAVDFLARVTTMIRRRGASDDLVDKQVEAAHLIAHLSGLRYFAVDIDADDDRGVLREIHWHQIARDIDNKDLKGLSIAGVNAPARNDEPVVCA